MAAIAHRLFGRTLASTEPHFPGGGRLEFDWRERRDLVRTVAEGLRLGTSTRAPPIALADLDLYRDWLSPADFRYIAHRFELHFALKASMLCANIIAFNKDCSPCESIYTT